MGKNLLVEALRSEHGDGYFENTPLLPSYKSGFPVLDYYLGYKVNVYNKKNEITESYNALGFAGGTYLCFIGLPSSGKTTFAVQLASEIVRPFDSGFVLHYDLEQGQNATRIHNLSKFPMTDIGEGGKYILRKGQNSISDIKKAIMQIYFTKKKGGDKFKYKTGKKDEFGNDIFVYIPTVVIIDSIPQLSVKMNENDSKDVKKLMDVSSQTEKMRLAAEISRFYGELAPYTQETNIIVISINQIKTKVGMGIMPTPADIMYLKQDESLPGGKAPQFLANYLMRFTAIGSEKHTKEDDGFDGFGSRLDIIKSRSNQAGKTVHMIYDKEKGFDSLRTSVQYAKEMGMLNGNKNNYSLGEFTDQKFTLKNMNQDFRDNPELWKILYGIILPGLENNISALLPEEISVQPEMLDY